MPRFEIRHDRLDSTFAGTLGDPASPHRTSAPGPARYFVDDQEVTETEYRRLSGAHEFTQDVLMKMSEMTGIPVGELTSDPIAAVKTWEDVRVRALHDPFLHRAVTMVERGDLTREQGLIAAVLALSELRERLLEQEVERLKNLPFRS